MGIKPLRFAFPVTRTTQVLRKVLRKDSGVAEGVEVLEEDFDRYA